MDVLSNVLQAVRLTGAVYFDIDASSPWVGESPGTEEIAAAIMPGAEHVISFHAVISGSCWATLSDGSSPPLQVEGGDVIVFPHGAPNVLSSSRGERGVPNMAMYYNPVDGNLPFSVLHGGGGPDRTHFICGYLGCDARPFNPLLAALPAMICARKPRNGRSWVTEFFQLAMAEGGAKRIGGETVLARLSELMFVEVIRQHIEALPDDSGGWLSGLRDPHVGEALRLIHARPTENWSVATLARQVGLSRSAFSARFSHFVEISPMHYLTRWRMQLATRLLEHPGTSIAQAASDVGYKSEAAFSRAFKRIAGTSPGAWRRHQAVEAGV